MIRLFWIPFVVGFAGCAPGGSQPRFESTPELLRLFGGEQNRTAVQHAYSSSYLSQKDKAGPVLYVDNRVGRRSDILGRSSSYDWTKPVDGALELDRDIRIEFTGEAYWKAENSGAKGSPVVVYLDRKRQVLEVQVDDKRQGRASYSPAAARLERFFAEIGVDPMSP